ncbi:DUF2971 domain-containing protein [Methylocystis sp. MJC1]|jgi:hypothetical protein|uniref:DUF2971 domain-containing protein n=1 Tax=Methylocystis sp. MJC1 TaxID=2654282 RepID=UPI0013ED4FC9|nr:DUF2971 domain-containing protein [Methylocystis sp. MJC1]KAF2990072.1 hypothetical protein MJC1_02732 [Methylocystis sp. MJC1]MBU6527671.1 DUF2971 domain-containing protein [Methylocystis sp. MJC1]UZX10607.1 DUF2971 domain-containing protein [Methylocystis sp. MJC1]
MIKEKSIEGLSSFGVVDEASTPILYHYCSVDTFLAIIQNKCLRLSDINTMNDFHEMHWAYNKFIAAANADLANYDRKFLDEIDTVLSGLQLSSLPLIGCFSRDGDVLSQWRAYADDGAGVALGLDTSLLGRLAVRFGQVVYDETEQLEYFRKFLSFAQAIWKATDSKPELRGEFKEFLFILAFDSCLMKNPAFSEEKEVRLIRATIVEMLKDGRWSLRDSEGSSEDTRSNEKQQIRYRARKGGIVAYIDLPLDGLGPRLVKEVVLGPRSLNNGIEVSMALASQGFEGFEVRHSTATYR